MFIIQPEVALDWQNALFILSHYHVNCVLYSDANDEATTHMLVHEDEEHSDAAELLRCAEMAFQMNWHQVGMICPMCKAVNEEFGSPETTCGHLTFSKPIKPAF